MIPSDDLAAVRDRLARLEEFVRRYADDFATAWLHDVADRISDERQALREVANVPRCSCGSPLPASRRGPMRRHCSDRCRKRTSRASRHE